MSPQGAAYDQARAACESLQDQIKQLQRQLAELSRQRGGRVSVGVGSSHEQLPTSTTGAGGAQVGGHGEPYSLMR